jgi:NitT/TauT family transport system substrate-binding protein
VIRARRQAVDFMYANPDESGDIIAKAYNLEPEVARSAVRNLTHQPRQVRRALLERRRDQPRSHERDDARAEDRRRAEGDPDWSKIIDESFLPDDLKKKTN